MRCILYNVNKRVGSTSIPLSQTKLADLTDFKLLAPTSMETPTLIFNRSNTSEVLNHNYVKLQFSDFDIGAGQTNDWKYYFLASRTILSNGQVACSYTEDFIGTFWDQIKNTDVRVSRSNKAILEQDYFNDPLTIMSGQQITRQYRNTNPLNITNGLYVIGMTIKNSDNYNPITTLGAVNYYLASQNGLATFVNDLSHLSGKLADINPMQFIVSCRYIPMSRSDIQSATGKSLSSVTHHFDFEFFDESIDSYTIEVWTSNASSDVATYEHIPYPNDTVHANVGTVYGNGSAKFTAIINFLKNYTGDALSDYDRVCLRKKTSGAKASERLSFNGYAPDTALTNPIIEISGQLDEELVGHTMDKHYLNEQPYLESYLYAGPYGMIPLNYNVSNTYGYIIDLDIVTGMSTLTLTHGFNNAHIDSKKDAVICPQISLAQTTTNSFIALEAAQQQMRASKIQAWNNVASNISRMGGMGADLGRAVSNVSQANSSLRGAADTALYALNKYPFSNATTNAINMVTEASGIASSASSALGGVIGGSIPNLLGAGISMGTAVASYSLAKDVCGLQEMQASMPQSSVRFANESFESLSLPWDYVQIEHFIVLPDYNAVGYPVYDDMKLADCSGVTTADGTNLKINGTVLERNAILECLQNGIFIEVNT